MTDTDEYVEDEVSVEATPPRRIRFEPIEWNNKPFDSMVLREPTGGQLVEVRKVQDPIAQALKLIQLNSGLPMQVVHMLPQKVIEAAGAYFEGFSPASPENGKA